VREYLLGVGIAVVVASAVTFAPMFEGAARSAHSGSPGERLIDSAFAAIYSDSEDDDAPASSQSSRMRLASLEMDFTADIASAGNEGQTTGSIPATDRASFKERFNSSYGERFSSSDERLGATVEGDGELTPRSVQRALPAAELGRDSPARLEAPKRQNARLAMLAPAANAAAVTQASAGAAPYKPMRPADPRSNSLLSDPSRTAIYDISARVVYLPNGERLEAHSGFGEHMDDPRSVSVKKRGVTPPNVYELSLRERLFHGVRAIRLNPVDPDKMFGRAGILAHSYLLGPNGQSHGCVSISDYPKFLNAFLNGEIDRLVVVERLADPPPPNTAVGWLSERLKAIFKSG
jgi:Protein of unknown function (DUF2778)